MSHSLDPDQGLHSVGPYLGPNCLQMLSADDTSRQSVNHTCIFFSCGPCCISSCQHYLTPMMSLMSGSPKTLKVMLKNSQELMKVSSSKNIFDSNIYIVRGFIKRREAAIFPFYSGMFPLLLLINLYRVYRQVLSNHLPTLL